jgi:hypothetical protein
MLEFGRQISVWDKIFHYLIQSNSVYSHYPQTSLLLSHSSSASGSVGLKKVVTVSRIALALAPFLMTISEPQ